MAYIQFKDGSSKTVDSPTALKLMLVQRGKREAPVEVHKYLETVESIHFNANRTMKLPPKVIEQGRLPYKDD